MHSQSHLVLQIVSSHQPSTFQNKAGIRDAQENERSLMRNSLICLIPHVNGQLEFVQSGDNSLANLVRQAF